MKSAAQDLVLSLLFGGRSITEIKGFRRFLIDWRTLGFLWACELWEKRCG
jgi:hypothetical protein